MNPETDALIPRRRAMLLLSRVGCDRSASTLLKQPRRVDFSVSGACGSAKRKRQRSRRSQARSSYQQHKAIRIHARLRLAGPNDHYVCPGFLPWPAARERPADTVLRPPAATRCRGDLIPVFGHRSIHYRNHHLGG
jgi:hypothetical protein